MSYCSLPRILVKFFLSPSDPLIKRIFSFIVIHILYKKYVSFICKVCAVIKNGFLRSEHAVYFVRITEIFIPDQDIFLKLISTYRSSQKRHPQCMGQSACRSSFLSLRLSHPPARLLYRPSESRGRHKHQQ